PPVEAVEAGPVDVRVARVERAKVALERAGVVLVDVWAPHPAGVGGADGLEDPVHVPPGGDELAYPVAVGSLRPGIPVAVHLRVEPQEERMTPVPRADRP